MLTSMTRGGLVFAVTFAAVGGLAAQEPAADRLRSVDDYLLAEGREVALALSAGPGAVARSASVLVLRRDGYETVRAGTNGFTCLVERSWTIEYGDPDQPHPGFWDPELLAPVCYNRDAAPVLRMYLRRTELALAGTSRAEMRRVVAADLEEGRLRPPSGAAIGYMLSAGQRLGAGGQFKPHVMIYIPYAMDAALGGNAVLGDDPVMRFGGTAWANIIVPTPKFNNVSTDAVRGGR